MSTNGKYRNPRAGRQALRRLQAKRRARGFHIEREVRATPGTLPVKCSSESVERTLTNAETDRQDRVDNAIYALLNELRPNDTSEIPWCIDCIALVRDAVMFALAEHTKLDEQEFYPWVEDDTPKED